MFVTSMTSTIAFLMCSITPIKPLKGFGIFSAMIVMLDFGLTVLMQPITYYFYEVYILDTWNRMFGYEVLSVDEKLEEEGYPLTIDADSD